MWCVCVCVCVCVQHVHDMHHASCDLQLHTADQSVPPILLEAILQEELPTDIYSVNISGLDNSIDLQNMMHDLLALQLQVNETA